MKKCMVALTLALAACDQVADGDRAAVPPVDELLRSGDPRVCADADAQKLAAQLVGQQVPFADYKQFEEAGGRIPFTEISATDVNRDISEVTCSANLNVGEQKFPLKFKVRPALDEGGGSSSKLSTSRTPKLLP
jgi:hypothetical protein